MDRRRALHVCWIPLTAACLLCSSGPASARYHILKKVVTGGEGSWDCLTVDPASRRLYISRSTHVMVVDIDSLRAIGDISPTPGVHGVALAPEFGRGFTSNGGDTSVTIFDPATLKTLGHARTGVRPDVIVYDAYSKRVFTMNAGSHDATAIDAATGEVAGTVDLGGQPEFCVVDGRGHLFVNLEDSSQVRVVDTKSLTAGARWSLKPGEGPTGLAMDVEHRRLFASCANEKLVVLDADSGSVVATLPIGKGPDGTGFDPRSQRAFISNGEGTLTVIHEKNPHRFKVEENVPTERGARTMALDPSTGRIFLVSAQFGPPPAPTADRPHPRPSIIPGTFEVLVVGE